MPVADKVSRSDVIAFRLNAHHLIERLDESGLLDAAGRCGIQNSPPGSALLALNARVRNITQEQVREAIAEEKSLLQTWCMRGAPFGIQPPVGAAEVTTGAPPGPSGPARHDRRRHGPARRGPARPTAASSLSDGEDIAGSGLAHVR